MADESLASVHQGTKPIELGDKVTTFNKWNSIRLTNKKLTSGLLFIGLVSASMLYVSLGANANGASNGMNGVTPSDNSTESNSAKADDQLSATSTSDQPTDDSSTVTVPNSDSVNVNLNSTSQSSTNPDHNSNTSTMTVNGHQVPVSGGNVHKTIKSADGSTTIRIKSSNSSNASDGGDN